MLPRLLLVIAVALLAAIAPGRVAPGAPGVTAPATGARAAPSHDLLHVHGAAGEGPCRCAEARQVNGWCAACAVGYVGGTAVRSADLFEALDPHGHEIDPASFRCLTCRTALREDGYCAACRMGFVSGQLYMSRLTWALARGWTVDPEAPACSHMSKGWCDACRMGDVGNVRFARRDQYELALREHARLLQSLEIVDRCAPCAIVMFTGGNCPFGHMPATQETSAEPSPEPPDEASDEEGADR